MRLVLIVGLGLALVACDDGGEDTCGGASAEPFPAALNFGEVKRAGQGDPLTDTVPARRTVLVRNGCSAALSVEQVCLVGDARGAFELEGPTPMSAARGEEIAVRVTYDADMPAERVDGERPADVAALVIVSNAADSPLVVPVCARLVGDGETPEAFDCPAAPELPDPPCGG
ncbi:MAG: hypothetical protein H6704_27480 [Myxococcales bacterium]|nr:hypothetical protein [Myxococcales bacterium]